MQLPHAFRKRHSRIVRAAILSLTICCAVVALSQSVFAKTTYVINDGHQVTVHSTYATNPADVLDEAGVELNHIDTFFTEDNEITVQRGQNVTIDHLGTFMNAVSYNETVSQLLTRLELLTEDVLVSVPLNAFASEGMHIRIYTTGITQGTYSEVIPYETVYQKTPYLPKGQEVVLHKGADGMIRYFTTVSLVNGKEVAQEVIGEEIVHEAVNEVIAVGTGKGGSKNGAPVIGDGVIITPDGKILHFDSVDVFEATAYMTMPPYTYETTATGTKVHKGTVAVDPKVIPYGTKMYIVSADGMFVYGEGTAEDCGPAIKNHRIDLFYFTFKECAQFGRRDCYVYFLTD